MKNKVNKNSNTFLNFRLEIDGDGWPPVGSESLPFIEREHGLFELTVPPLFLKGLSVGDCISVDFDNEEYVSGWKCISPSRRSTVWLLKGSATNFQLTLENLKRLRCNVERFPEMHLCAIDIPETVALVALDEIIGEFEDTGGQVAYPSFRHE